MKEILQRLIRHETLSKEEAASVLTAITEERYNNTQIASFITTFLMRSITPEELDGFRLALMNLCYTVDTRGMECIDVCGTGGDGKNTFNISTISAFVTAGAGYKVTKHGNKSVSSNCGSSDVLTSLGYQFSNDEDTLLQQLEKANFCYLHAPMFHPALKTVGGIRKELGLKTFFNMLGPLVNPASPSRQLVGVFSLSLMRLYHHIFDHLGHDHAIIHGLDGYDEISLTSATKVISSKKGTYQITPEEFGMSRIDASEIFGGDTIEEAQEIFLRILENKASEAQKNVVIANSALAINCYKNDNDLSSSIEAARESIESGRAMDALKMAIELSKK